MTSSIQAIKKFFQSITRRGGSYGDHGVIHPEREWFTALTAGVLLVLVGVGWAVQVYWRYDQMINNPTFVQDTSDPTYREAMVARALATLDERQKQYESLERQLRGSGEAGMPAVEELVVLPATTTASTTPVEEGTGSTTAATSAVSVIEETSLGEVAN